MSARDDKVLQDSNSLQNEQSCISLCFAQGRTGQSVSKWFPLLSHPTHSRRSSGTSKPKNVFHPFRIVVLFAILSTFLMYAGQRSQRYPQNPLTILLIIPPIQVFLFLQSTRVADKTQTIMTTNRSSAGRATPFFFLSSEKFLHSICCD